MDESYIPGGKDAPFILSGCVSSLAKWDRYDAAWKGMLRRYKLPYIHAQEFSKNKGVFKGLSTDRKVELAGAIDRAMVKHLHIGFSTILMPGDFSAYKNTGNRDLSNMLDSEFGVSFRIALSFLHSQISSIFSGEDPQVYVVVEKGHINSGAALEVFKQYERDEKDALIKSVAYVDKSYYGVQSADVRGYLLLLDESQKIADFRDIDINTESIQTYMKNVRLPWFRLPVKPEMLTELRDNLILSRPKFRRLYGEHLSSKALASSAGQSS